MRKDDLVYIYSDINSMIINEKSDALDRIVDYTKRNG